MIYKNLLPLVDFDGLEKLKRTNVAVIGCGGVGAYSVTALARSGIGSLILVDPDAIEAGNINRQLMAFHSTLGTLKTEWLKAHIQDINPDIHVDAWPVAYEASLNEKLFALKPDYIIDAIDDMPAKKALIEAALDRNVPIISVLAQGNRIGSGTMMHTTLPKTTYDPIARRLRQHFKRHPKYKTIEVIINDAPVDIPPDGAGCVASTIFSPAMAGLKAAETIIKKVIL